MIRTLPYADLLVHGDEALVLLGEEPYDREPSPPTSDDQGGTIVRLSAIGVAVLELAETGISFEALASALEAEFGAPPTGSTKDALQAVLEALQAQRLVHLDEGARREPRVTDWRICDHTAFVISSPDRVVVYNLDDPRTQPLALLGTGASIWQCLVGPDDDHLRPWCTEPDVLQQLAEAYQTDVAKITDDVRALLAQLSEGGYVESADEGE